MLIARGIQKSYGDVTALAGADLDVSAGQIVALLGRNGAGKTTMLSVIAGLVRPDAGTVRIGEVDALAHPIRAARMIGIAPQQTGIYPVLTVAENLRFFAELAGLDAGTRRARTNDVAEQLGLGSLLDRRGSELSGGEARRLHTACALLHRPALLMLDEPTVGADVGTRAQLIEVVSGLAAEGAAVIYTTHYLPEVETLDADIVIIDDGRILARGRREELMRDHSKAAVEIAFDNDTVPTSLIERFGAYPIGAGRYRIDRQVQVAQIVAWLGPDADRVLSVEVAKPDLERVFMAVTGTSLDDEPVVSEVP